MERIVFIVALIVMGPLVGLELAVVAVINPLAAKLPDSGFRVVRGGGSRWLGMLMPFWYLVTLALLVALAAILRDVPAIAATVVMAAIMVLTVTVLVPINNRIARWTSDADVDRGLAGRWDRFHWLRVAMLFAGYILIAISAR